MSGLPVRKIVQYEPLFNNGEGEALAEYMKSGGWCMEFRKTREFEGALANYCGVRHCIAVNNGTISLTLMCMACGIGAGDEVLVPNYTMIATANAVKLAGANPIFVDVEAESLWLDLALAENALSPKTRAIFVVSPNGRPPCRPIEEYLAFAERHGLYLLEDAAQALGSFYPGGKHVGSVGLVGSLSFSVPKIITTGQGGAILTDDDALAERIRKLKDFGRTSGGSDIHDSVGYNFKFTDLQAVVGLCQMRSLEWRRARKKEIYGKYHKMLSGLPEIKFFIHDLELTTPWFMDILAEKRDALQNFLAQAGIVTRRMYPPINAQKAYGRPGAYPVSGQVGAFGLWLPSSPQLTDGDIELICLQIYKFYRSWQCT